MADYYLNADTGNDTTGDGSYSLPWLTIALSKAKIAINDALILQDSTAHYAFTASSMVANITIKGESYGGAVLDGQSVANSRWTIYGITLNLENLDITGMLVNSGYGSFMALNTGTVLNIINCRLYGITLDRSSGINGPGFFYSGGSPAPSINIYGTIIYDNSWLLAANGIFSTSNVTAMNVTINNSIIHFNSVSGEESATLISNYNSGIIDFSFVNSIIYNTQAVSVNLRTTATGTSTADYTCISGTFTSEPTGTANVLSDPLFLDDANGDYRLSSTSPCINAGLMT